MQIFLTRGLVAILWAAAVAVASDSLTKGVTAGAGILLVRYPAIDVVGSLLDERSQYCSARRLLLANAAPAPLRPSPSAWPRPELSRTSWPSSASGPSSVVPRSSSSRSGAVRSLATR